MNGQWGTACHNFWNLADGAVACQQLGLGLVYDTVRNSPFGSGDSIPILLDYIACGGLESRLQDCSARTANFPSTQCDRSKIVGLVCNDASKQLHYVLMC